MTFPARPLLILFGLLIPVWVMAALKPVADQCSLPVEKQPLEQVLPCYLQQPDNAFEYSLEGTSEIQDQNLTVYTFRLISQHWQPGGMDSVDHAIWQHRVSVYMPRKVKHSVALLYVNGGTLYPRQPPEPDRNEVDFARIASDTGSVVVNLQDVPNQFLTFPDAGALKEDDIIVHGWNKFLEDPKRNRYWLPRLPMVKSVIRTMDMVQEFAANKKTEISEFVVSGGSKRGWTAWLSAAMDSRVSAVVPMVIDVLNLRPSMKHHFRSYNFWAPAVNSYKKITPFLDTEEMDDLLTIIDPYSYRKYLTVPKYIITASADDFFLPDSSQFYFDKLPSYKWLRVLPNERHYIVRSNANLVTNTLLSFYGAHLDGRVLPGLNWQVNENVINITVDKKPESAQLWQASNPDARDFRVTADNPGVKPFVSEQVWFNCHNICELKIEMTSPQSGWNAYFLQLNYENNNYPDLVLTTPVIIYPNSYPDLAK